MPALLHWLMDVQDLVLLAPPVNFVEYSGMQNGGVPAASMEPAIASPASSPAEFFLDSLDPNATIDNRLGVWAITNEAVVDTGTPTLSGRVITSETYGQPPLAQEKQPATSTCTPTNRSGLTVLETDDDRMLQSRTSRGRLASVGDF